MKPFYIPRYIWKWWWNTHKHQCQEIIYIYNYGISNQQPKTISYCVFCDALLKVTWQDWGFTSPGLYLKEYSLKKDKEENKWLWEWAKFSKKNNGTLDYSDY